MRKWPRSLGFLLFMYFFPPFPFFLFSSFCGLQCLTFYWAYLQLNSEKASLKKAIFTMEKLNDVARNFALHYSLEFASIFV